MRFSLMCMGCLVAVSTLQLAVADQPSGHADADARKELAELKQLAAKLSTRIESLERTMQGKQKPAVAPMGFKWEVAQTGFEAEAKKMDKPRAVTKSYKVAELAEIRGDFATAIRFDPIIRYIQTNIAPEQWEAKGGPGTMAPYPANLSLVISTTEEVHEQIRDWLEEMRAARQLLANFEKTKFSALK